MKCKRCNFENNNNNAEYCANCGIKLERKIKFKVKIKLNINNSVTDENNYLPNPFSDDISYPQIRKLSKPKPNTKTMIHDPNNYFTIEYKGQ